MRFRNPAISRSSLLLLGFIWFVSACDGNADSGSADSRPQQEMEPVTLGPRDGLDLPPTDLERVAVGTVAPDFSLLTLAGDTITLSQFRGLKDVILVFYRGHW